MIDLEESDIEQPTEEAISEFSFLNDVQPEELDTRQLEHICEEHNKDEAISEFEDENTLPEFEAIIETFVELMMDDWMLDIRELLRESSKRHVSDPTIAPSVANTDIPEIELFLPPIIQDLTGVPSVLPSILRERLRPSTMPGKRVLRDMTFDCTFQG